MDLHPEQVLERVDRAHLVRDRADAADPGDDVDDLVRRPAHDQRLEVAGRLEDLRAAPPRRRRRGRAGGASPRPRRGSGSRPGTGGHPRGPWVPLVRPRRALAAGAAAGAGPHVGGPSRSVSGGDASVGRSGSGGRPPSASVTDRNGAAAPVKPAKRRPTSIGSRPPSPSPAAAPVTNARARPVGVRALARAEAAVAAAPEGRADRAAAGPRHGPEAGQAAGHHDARDAAPLALQADRLVGQLRPAAGGERGQELDQLLGVDRAAAQLGVHRHEVGDGPRRRERIDVRRDRVDGGPEGLVLGGGAERLDAAGGRARADRRRGAFASARSRAISTACSGVEIEPSTRRTSNGPEDRRDVASANSTMSNRSAISRSSSSRSRIVSWQPSHEANLTTPTRGRRVAVDRPELDPAAPARTATSITGPPAEGRRRARRR